MAQKQRRFKLKRFVGFIYIALTAVFIYVLSINVLRVIDQRSQYEVLVDKKKALEKEKTALSKEVNLLSDDDYVTRYARDNYIFSKKGEEVVKLPEK